MSTPDWQSSASIDSLKKYARMLQSIRVFFQQRDVLEVTVPCIASTSSPAPHLDSITVNAPFLDVSKASSDAEFYLQTSPEFFMKRLLCSGSGSIYRMGPAFRRGEISSRHNPEFTMLEWYRTDWHYHQLMDEVAELVVSLLGELEIERLTYSALFQKYVGIDPHCATIDELAAIAWETVGYQPPKTMPRAADNQPAVLAKDEWLELIFSGYILPKTSGRSILVFEFPAGQAELAEIMINKQGQKVASRFELYVNGIELANGYQELTDSRELHQRFELWNIERRRLGKPVIELDKNLLDAQSHGLPRCSGVALGIDRVAMCLLETTEIRDILAFPVDRV
ncbi:MAG: EF-P lysine aminoacylase GenX [Pseudomonadales bacterium]|nr:EF-P lysine aminoacylase GenX [Pseudomonadales bacterium]